MKRIITISLLCIIGFSQGGYFIFSAVHQFFLKEEMKEKIAEYHDEKNLICISYSDNAKEIVWEREGKEFFFKTRLYDIVRTENIKGKVFFYCVNDEKEHKLITQNNETAKTNSTQSEKSGVSKIELPIMFFAEGDCKSYVSSRKEKITILFKSKLHESNEDLESPPPKTYLV